MSTKRLPPFPDYVMSGVIGDFVRLVSSTTECPDALLFGAGLAAFSILLGRDVHLRFGPTGALFPNLVVGLLGETGSSRKSTAIDSAVSLLVAPLLPPRVAPGAPLMLEVSDGSGSGEGFFEAIVDKEWTPRGAAPQIVTGRRALFVIHELSELLAKVKRDQAGGMGEFLLRAYDAPRLWTHRTKGRELTATNALAVVLAGATLSNLGRTLSTALVTGGLANRFLWLAGERKGPMAVPPSPDPAAVVALQHNLAACLAAVRGRVFELHPEAVALHTELYATAYERAERVTPEATFTRREDVNALKIAMILAAAEGTPVISFEHLDAAWRVIEHARDVAMLLVEAAPPPRTRAEAEVRVHGVAERLAHKQGGVFTIKQVATNMRGERGLDFPTTLETFNGLVAAGDIAPVAGSPDLFHIVIVVPEPGDAQ